MYCKKFVVTVIVYNCIIHNNFRFVNVKYGSETGTVLLHAGDDKNDLNKLKPKIAHIFNLKTNKIKLLQENDIVIAQLK